MSRRPGFRAPDPVSLRGLRGVRHAVRGSTTLAKKSSWLRTLGQPAPRVSVVVCSLNGEKVLPACLKTLMANCGVPFEVIVVDNGSTDSTAELVRRDFPGVRLIHTGRNLGFAGGNNIGLHAARGDLFVLLNDDTETPPDWLANLTAPFERDPRIAAVGCKLLFPDGKTIQHAGGALYPNALSVHKGCGETDRGQWDTPGEQTYVTGAALALRRAALEQIGLLDPGFFPAYFEETDLQIRLRDAGWRIWYEPSACLIHHESQSLGGANSSAYYYRYTRSRIRYLALTGFRHGKWRALGWELRWLATHVIPRLRLTSVLRAYLCGLWHWRAWRADRETRRTIPHL